MLPEPHSHLRLFEQELERQLDQKALVRAARAAARERGDADGRAATTRTGSVGSAGLGSRLRAILVSLATGTLLAAIAFPGVLTASAPSSSGLVVRFEDNWFVGYRDAADQLVAMTGPPAELGCHGLGFDDYVTEAQWVETPPGAVVLHIHRDAMPVWIYRASLFAEVCEAVLASAEPDLVASGTVRFEINDNDLFVSETRTNAFGDRATGTVAGADGSLWSFTGVFRALIAPSEGDDCECRVVREDVTLVPRGG